MLQFKVVLLAAVVAISGQLAASQERAQFIHPTFDHANTASILDSSGRLAPVGIMKTKGAIAYVNDGPIIRLTNGTYLPEASADTALPESNAPNIISYTRSAPILYDEEKVRTREHVSSTVKGEECFKFPFRAFEFFLDEALTNAYAVGLDQGIGLCFVIFKTTNITEAQTMDSAHVQSSRMLEYPRTYYRVSAMWAVPSFIPRTVDLMFLDEAGFQYKYILTTRSGVNLRPSADPIKSLSAMNLDALVQGSFDHANQSDPIAEIDVKSQTTMTKHYGKSYVEAITMVDNSLVYSRGLFVVKQPPLMSIRKDDSKKLPFPPQFLSKTLNDLVGRDKVHIVLALEAYMLKNQTYILQMGLVQVTNQFFSTKPIWANCRFTDPSQAFPDGKLQMSAKSNGACIQETFPNGKMPIDIVYIERCNTLYLIYQHYYYEQTANAPLRMKHINWMNYPVNAVLYANNRLYLFIGGSELYITKDLGNECSLENVQFETSYRQSQLLFQFQEDLLGAQELAANGSQRVRYSELPPMFDSTRHRFGNGLWDPPLDNFQSIPSSYALLQSPGPAPAPPTPGPITTTPRPPGPQPEPTPGPSNDSNTSIIIVVIIVVIIAAFVMCSIYYFCFGSSEELPPIKSKNSRKSKTSHIPVSQIPPSSSAAAVGTPPTPPPHLPPSTTSAGSSHDGIASAATVRSAMTGSPTSAVPVPIPAMASSTSPMAKLKSKAKSIAKSIVRSPASKSARSPGARPISKSKSKSPQSSSPGMGSHKTKSKSSPGHKTGSNQGTPAVKTVPGRTHSHSKKSVVKPKSSPSSKIRAAVDSTKKPS